MSKRNLAILSLSMSLSLPAPMAAFGLATLAAPAAQAAPLRNQGGPYELEVLTGGAPARTFYHSGETYVLGHQGERYVLRVHNRSGRRIEAVLTVDGRDVVDGKPGDFRSKRGYVIGPWGHIDIEGFRLSQGQVAAFRFSSVADSYAARTGSAREVGVIGLAVFPEREAPPVYVPMPAPPPPRRYYPEYYDDLSEREKDRAAEESPAGPPAAHKSAPQASSTPAAPPDEQPPATRSEAGGALRGRADVYRPYQRPGLGTAFGEAVDSRVYETEFIRQNPSRPSVVLGVRYNDHDGLLAMGVDVDGWRRPYDDAQVRRTADPFPATDRSYANPPPGWEYR